MSEPWLTVLTTNLRPQYLVPTLDALDGHGGAAAFQGRKIVMFDGTNEGFSRPGWESRTVKPGEIAQTTQALGRILGSAYWEGCPYLLYFEDDVQPCKDAVLAMAEMEVPLGIAFLTFCNQKVGCDHTVPHIQARRADEPRNKPGHWGAQAMKIPRRTLELIAKARLPIYGFASDVWLGQHVAAGRSPERRYGIVLPSLVRHTGEVTTIGLQKDEKWEGHRLGLNYAGDDADAVAIVRAIAGRVRLWPEEE